MQNGVEGMLYIDPQARKPIGFCKKCGGALYAPSRICLRCRRDIV